MTVFAPEHADTAPIATIPQTIRMHPLIELPPTRVETDPLVHDRQAFFPLRFYKT